MSKTMRVAANLALIALVAGSAVADSDYAVVGRTLEPVRSDFNAAQGHVRAVLLVAPS